MCVTGLELLAETGITEKYLIYPTLQGISGLSQEGTADLGIISPDFPQVTEFGDVEQVNVKDDGSDGVADNQVQSRPLDNSTLLAPSVEETEAVLCTSYLLKFLI